jgi:ABC-type branched-subunit amino acid transport system substrate-binding protein
MRQFAGLAVTAVIAIGVAASAPPTTAGAQSGAQGVTDKEIKVAGLGTTPYGFTEDNIGAGAKARFAAANKAGELPGGRKIKMVAWGDDKADAPTNVQEQRRLIQQEGVFAIVPTGSVFMQGEVANASHTPVFGYGIAQAFCEDNPKNYFFGFNGCVVPLKPATAGNVVLNFQQVAIKEGILKEGATPKIAIMGDDNATGQQAVAMFAAAAKGNGMDVVYAKAPSPPPPAVVGDYSPFVGDVLATNPDIITSVGVTPDYIGIGKALKSANYKGMYVVPEADKTLTEAIGPYYGYSTWAASQETTPNVKRMLADIKAYDPRLEPSSFVQAGWLAADQFITALKKVGKNVTADKVQQVAAKMTYFQKGLIGPTKYPTNWKYTDPTCRSIIHSDGTGQYTVVAGYACSPKRYPIKPYNDVVTP